MKNLTRSLFVSLILSLLLCLSVFAYNRTIYKKTSKRYYMTAIGLDKNPKGSEEAYATARLDLDYPGEDGKNHNRMDLFSYARVSAIGSGGTYSISASAYMIYKNKSKEWRWFIHKAIDADVRLKYDPKNFDLKEKWAKNYFYMVAANAQIDNSKGEQFEGHARDFSHGEPDKWVCLTKDGEKNHGNDETCVVCDSDITE